MSFIWRVVLRSPCLNVDWVYGVRAGKVWGMKMQLLSFGGRAQCLVALLHLGCGVVKEPESAVREFGARRDAICADTGNEYVSTYSGEFGVPFSQSWLRAAASSVVQIDQSCTGTLIAPDLVLTADHCVRSQKNIGCSQTVTPTEVLSEWNADGAYFTVGVRVAQVEERHDCEPDPADFAVLRLDAPIRNVRYLLPSVAESGASIVALGYAQGGGMRAGVGVMSGVDAALVPVMGGYSGGPLFNGALGQAAVISAVDCSAQPQAAALVAMSRVLAKSPSVAGVFAAVLLNTLGT